MKKIVPKSLYIGRIFQAKNVLISSLFLVGLIFLPLNAQAGHKAKKASQIQNQAIHVTEDEILKNSQISYSADGGFSGIKSFGVIISCVNGKISTLKSVHDPRRSESSVRQAGSMDTNTYVELWKSLMNQQAFTIKSVPEPKIDITDELTLNFETRVGTTKNEFQVHGISRPEACHHFAVKSLIDSAVQMQAFIGEHQNLALK